MNVQTHSEIRELSKWYAESTPNVRRLMLLSEIAIRSHHLSKDADRLFTKLLVGEVNFKQFRRKRGKTFGAPSATAHNREWTLAHLMEITHTLPPASKEHIATVNHMCRRLFPPGSEIHSVLLTHFPRLLKG